MLERAIPGQQRIVFDEKLEGRASSSRVATLRRLRELLRAIGEFVATGGPLS